MPRFMGIIVLVLDPDFGFARIPDAVAYNVIDLGAEQTEQLGTHPRRHTSEPVVQPNHDDSARLDLLDDRVESTPCVARVMKDARADHDIKDFVLDSQFENVHLNEGYARYLVADL